MKSYLIVCAFALAALPAVAETDIHPDPAEVNQAVASQVGQLVIQLVQAQSMISAQAKEIARLNAELKNGPPKPEAKK